MNLDYQIWLLMTLYVSDKSIEVIWDHLESFFVTSQTQIFFGNTASVFSMKTIKDTESNQPVIMHEMNELNNMQNR